MYFVYLKLFELMDRQKITGEGRSCNYAVLPSLQADRGVRCKEIHNALRHRQLKNTRQRAAVGIKLTAIVFRALALRTGAQAVTLEIKNDQAVQLDETAVRNALQQNLLPLQRRIIIRAVVQHGEFELPHNLWGLQHTLPQRRGKEAAQPFRIDGLKLLRRQEFLPSEPLQFRTKP